MVAESVVHTAPLASATVVMATGIVAVAARDAGHQSIALVLVLIACTGWVMLVIWAAVAYALSGHGLVRSPTPIDRICGHFGFVAAVDVIAAQFDPPAGGIVVVLGVAALAAWAILVPRLIAVLRTAGLGALPAHARGSWLLVVVATQSLALTAARLTTVGAATAVLVVAAFVWWTAGGLAYLVIVALTVRRLLRARLAPALLTPDIWILMGAAAITAVAGGTLVHALGGTPTVVGNVGAAVVFGCWLVATAWIPLLVTAEVRRARERRPGYEPSRWSSVFPLGMYAVACATLASIAPTARPILQEAAAVAFWVALAAWCATAVGMIAMVTSGSDHAAGR